MSREKSVSKWNGKQRGKTTRRRCRCCRRHQYARRGIDGREYRTSVNFFRLPFPEVYELVIHRRVFSATVAPRRAARRSGAIAFYFSIRLLVVFAFWSKATKKKKTRMNEKRKRTLVPFHSSQTDTSSRCRARSCSHSSTRAVSVLVFVFARHSEPDSGSKLVAWSCCAR